MYYKVAPPRKRRVVRLPKENRVFTCQTCAWPCRVVPSAISTQCENCGIYLDLRSYRIVGTNGDPLFTHGTIEFASTCAYRGMEVVADQIFVAGRVHARLRAFTSIELQEKGSVRGWQHAPLIRVADGASVVALNLEADVVEVFGTLQADTILARQKLKIHAGGAVVAREITCAGLEVARGAALQGQIHTLQPQQGEVAPQPVDGASVVLKRETANKTVSTSASFFFSS
jgi:cytoskeletal protein CcmA (bactofilin family)